MPRPHHLIRNLAEHLPRRHQTTELPTQQNEDLVDEQSRLWHEELETDRYNDPYYTLAESLDMFYAADSATASQQDNVRSIITADAHDLAARILNESLVEVLDITPKHPENVGLEYAGSFSLRSMYLLVNAYDITRDEPLEHTIRYVFASAPPHLSEQLKRAFEHGQDSGEPIIPVYQMLTALQDDALDIRLAAAGKADNEMAATGAVDAIAFED
jgi:hypothetical protein